MACIGGLSVPYPRHDGDAEPDPVSAKPSLKPRDTYVTAGGPIRKDKLHFFASYEKSDRSLPSVQNLTAANAAAIGLPASDVIWSYPFSQANQFVFGRVDWQINDKNRLMGRYMYYRNDSPWNPNNTDTASGLKAASTADTEFVDRAHAAGAQLITIFSPYVLNEFRFALGYRNEVQAPTSNSPKGPQIVITNAAGFGAPDDISSALIKEATPEFSDNVSLVRGSHNMKFGGDIGPFTTRKILSSIRNTPLRRSHLIWRRSRARILSDIRSSLRRRVT